MTIHLVRHARAGRRNGWEGPDEIRPISKAGRRQTRDLTAALASTGITQVLSSPYVRCVQTAEPLADVLGLEVEVVDCLAEGAGVDRVLGLVAEHADDDVMLCTHGDVVEIILKQVRRDGVKLRAPKTAKGSVWTLEVRKGRFVGAKYRPPRDA